MEYREYENFDEKKAVLETIFGQWPPPFDPVWAIQVSQGRCGSNELWRIVKSFFENAIGQPVYEALDHPESDAYEELHENLIPKPGKHYLYYNAFSRDPHRLHFPIFFWFLQNSPKIVHLTREDHLTRAISIYYANLVRGLPTRDEDIAEVHKVYEMPVDMDHLEEYIQISITEIEVIKQLVSEFVSEDRLLRMAHRDLYHTDTLQTLQKCAAFLECDLQTTRASISLYKETSADRIPNSEEISERYQRDLTEHAYWVPNDLDMEPIHNQIQENVSALIGLNADPEPARKRFHFKMRFGSEKTHEKRQFDLKADQKFYIDEIPKSARYLPDEEFRRLPNLETQLYMVDDRWESLELEADDIPSHVREFVDVTDIHENRERDDYEWVCGFSVFFLKGTNDPEHQDHRYTAENHDKLIAGVDRLTSYEERCPETLLRFYVSPEVWERLASEGILYRPNTEFFKMRFASESSQLGTVWRMLCLSDPNFEWAIQADCAPDEDWILARIAHWDRHKFKSWSAPENGRTFNWAGEYLFFDNNWDPDLRDHTFHPENRAWNLNNIDFMSSGGIVTRPAEMPDMNLILERYISQAASMLTFYHAEADVFSYIHQRERWPSYGWEGFGEDQEMWRLLKKAMPVRHLIHSQSIKHLEKYDLPEEHLIKRLVSQLISEGSEFVDIETQSPIFNLI